jgi:hypothetical protein
LQPQGLLDWALGGVDMPGHLSGKSKPIIDVITDGLEGEDITRGFHYFLLNLVKVDCWVLFDQIQDKFLFLDCYRQGTTTREV